MHTFWHFEQVASGKPEWPRRVHPLAYDDANPAAKGHPGVVEGLAPYITRRVQEARLVGAEVGFLWWNPGGVTPRPTPENPEHCDYPDHPFAAARNWVTPAGDKHPMMKLGSLHGFASACKRLRELGVTRLGAYLGYPGQWDGGAGVMNAADPELIGLVERGLLTHIVFDGTAHMPPLPIRERAMRTYEAAGAVVGYEAIPDFDGPGSDLGKNPGRVCCSYLDEWDGVQEREKGQAYHPARNVPAGYLPHVLLLDRHDDPMACAGHVAAGREVAINFAAEAWQSVNLGDLWSGAKVKYEPRA